MAFQVPSLWKPNALDDQVTHPLGQPLIIFAQILAQQNLANVSRSNYVYLVLCPPISIVPCSLPLPLSLAPSLWNSLYNHRLDCFESFSPLIPIFLKDAYNADQEKEKKKKIDGVYFKHHIIRHYFYMNHICPFTHYILILGWVTYQITLLPRRILFAYWVCADHRH